MRSSWKHVALGGSDGRGHGAVGAQAWRAGFRGRVAGGRWQVGSKASEGPGVLTLALALVPYPGAAVEEEDPLGQGGVSPQEGVGPGPGRHLPPGQEDGAASPFPPQSLWILAVGGGQTRTIRGPLWGRGDRTCKRVLRGQGRPQLTSEGKRE